MKVLLVVDQARAAAVVSDLRSGGWQVVTASDVPSALSVARREAPDVIVASDRLPGGGGPMLVARLRGLLATALTPIIALGGDASADAAMRSVGATDSIPTDADASTLLAALHRAVHGARPAAPEVAPDRLLSDRHRLRTLEATGLVAGEADPWFDRVTRIAIDLLPTATSLVSLVDRYHQFFPGRSDLDPAGGDRQTPLSQSFCQWAVTSGQRLVVEDARNHDVLRHNQATKDLSVTAYAGVPITVDGATLGTMCAVDYEPRRWDDEDLMILEQLAVIAQAEIAIRLAAPIDPGAQHVPRTVVAAVNRGIGSSSALLTAVRPDVTRPAFDGLVGIIAWFNRRLSHVTG